MKRFFSFLAALWIVAAGTLKAENEIYAVYSTDGKTMTLYYDDQRAARSGVADWLCYNDLPQHRKDLIWAVETVVLDISMKEARPKSTMGWFFWHKGLTHIEHLEYLNTENVTTMQAMFNSCSNLKEVDVSTFNTKNVTNMNGMFAFCEKLESLDVRNFDMQNVTDISEMFAVCTELTTILCDDDWSKYSKMVASQMFYNCPKLVGGKGTVYNAEKTDKTYARPDGGTGAPGYFTGKELYAVLDGTTTTFYYDDKKAERGGARYWEMGWSAEKTKFPNNTTKVVFDPSVNDARPTSTSYWFDGFEKLEQIVNINYLHTDRVTNMDNMFNNCKALTELDVTGFNTANVTSMEAMFMYCSKLETLDVTNFDVSKVKNISRLFAFDYKLKTIICPNDWRVRPDNTDYDNSDYMFMECNQLVGGRKTVYDVSHIGIEYACPDGGTSAPGYFTKLLNWFGESITWEVTGTTLHIDGAGDMPEGEYEDIPWNSYKDIITEIIIASKDITSVCPKAFYQFEKLESVSYPENSALKKIGASAFEGCLNLTEITIPDNTTEIGARCFNDCESATSLTLSKNMTVIPEQAFYDCISLLEIGIPDNITEIGIGAFAYCYDAASLTLSKNITVIPEDAFAYCKSLTEIVIPDNITELGEDCFAGCESAASLTLSKNITVIPQEAFFECKSLSELTLPEGVTAIEALAFSLCGITELVLPESLTSLEYGAFGACYELTKVTLPQAIESIGEMAFRECLLLADVECPAITPPALGAEAFLDIKSGAKLHVYRSFVDAYAATDWADWFSIKGSIVDCKVTAASSDETMGEVSITFDSDDILSEKDGVFIVRENAKAHLVASVTGENSKFVSWNDDAEDNTELERDVTVTSDFDFVALFAPVVVYFTVTYYDWDLTPLGTEQVEEGHDAKGLETDPEREGYTFIGWSKPLTNITADLSVAAQYEKKDPTAIEETESDTHSLDAAPRKFLRNGTLYIDRNSTLYTPLGARLN